MAMGVVRKVKIKNINVTYIQPVESLGSVLGSLDFNRERAEGYIKLG